MKKFLIITGSFLIGALAATIIIFWYINSPVSPVSQISADKNNPSQETATTSAEQPTAGVPLRDLPLSDAQKATLDTMGIDVETFVITPAMQDCAAEKLGAARMEEIIAGAAPSFSETTKLLSCL